MCLETSCFYTHRNSNLTFLKAVTVVKAKGNSHDFYPKGFSKTIKFNKKRILNKKLHLHYSISHKSKFQDKRLFVYSFRQKFFCLELVTKSFSFQKHRMRREFCCEFTGGQHRGYSIKDLVCTIVIFQVPFVFNTLVSVCINLHTKCQCHQSHSTKTRVSVLTTPKTIHCVSLIVSVIKYEHKVCFWTH